jgi:peptidoglycan/xylan/chitin deacetylase (PgdA/CDA1 family)
VCLTFDDGPSKTTKSVLDTLAVENVPATFFVVASGYNNDYLPLIRRAQNEGHQIALHSASHDYSDIYQSSEAYWADIELLRERISPYVDVSKITCLRFPGGSTNTVSRKYGGSGLMKQLKEEVEERGYHWVDWNVCAEDAVGGHPSSGTVYRNVIQEVNEQKTCIVLMHDSATTSMTAEALPDIIAWFRDQGYVFCTVNDLYSDQEES